MDHERNIEISKLKKYIAESKDLSEPLNYFFDLMNNSQILNVNGHRRVSIVSDHPDFYMATKIAIETASQILNKDINVLDEVFHEIPREKFYHGHFTFSDNLMPIILLYCSDIQLGVSAIIRVDGVTNFFRFALADAKNFKNKH